jgi:hypothetical protein
MTHDFSGNKNLDKYEMRLPSNVANTFIHCGKRTLKGSEPQSRIHSLASGTMIAMEHNK